MRLSPFVAIGLAFLAGCAQQVEQYETNQPIETQVQPDVTVCLDMTMAGCQPLAPSAGAFGPCENLDPLEQQEEGCWQGHGDQ